MQRYQMQKYPFQPTALAAGVRAALVGSSAALAMGVSGLAAASTEVDELKEQMQILMQRIEQLEQEQDEIQSEQADLQEQVEAVPGNVVTKGDIPRSFKLPGSNTSVEVSGYVKLDAIFDADQDLGDSFAASSILPDDDADKEAFDSNTRFHARQSRFRVRTNTDLGNDRALKTHFEGDFFGAGGNQTFSNSTSFRLRHAYATFDYGGYELLAGQTWSNFMDLVAYPSTVDFFGPAGKSFVRQAQLRWTLPSGISFSLENPETDGFGQGAEPFELGDRLREAAGGPGEDELPDLTVAWRGGPGGAGGSYELAGVLRDLGVNGELSNGVRVNENETGWGINLAGAWVVNNLTFMGSATAGDGIGRYIINGFGNDVFVSADGSVDTVESAAVTAALQVDWSDKSNSTLAFGHFENDQPALSNGIDTLDTVHLNYRWFPWPATTFGAEVVYGKLDNANGSDGDATRFQFAVQRSF